MSSNNKKKTEDETLTKRVTATVSVNQWKELALDAINKLGSNSPSDMVQYLIEQHLNNKGK